MELQLPSLCLDEYQKLVNRMNTPRVVFDNNTCATATLMKVDSARKHGALLEAVQLLADLNLSVNKAYLSSDGRWSMDVFHVTDRFGRKLVEESAQSYIEQCLGARRNNAKADCSHDLTAVEMSGANRPGLLSEVFAVLSDLHCDVVEANVWTHHGRIASFIHVKHGNTQKLCDVVGRLRNVLMVDGDHVRYAARATAGPCSTVTHADRRLHQIMFDDRDYERPAESSASSSPRPSVTVQNWADRRYSIINVQCGDRPKLLFDVVCTLTDMEYVVFHGVIDTDGDQAYQEFYIRHADGSPISSEAERQRVVLCLQAAIQRRAFAGTRLELTAADRRGLLSDVTRALREHGLSVTRAEVSAKGGVARGVFYVADVAGNPADAAAVEAARRWAGAGVRLKVAAERPRPAACREARRVGSWEDGRGVAGLIYLGGLVRRNLYNLGLIKSC